MGAGHAAADGCHQASQRHNGHTDCAAQSRLHPRIHLGLQCVAAAVAGPGSPPACRWPGPHGTCRRTCGGRLGPFRGPAAPRSQLQLQDHVRNASPGLVSNGYVREAGILGAHPNGRTSVQMGCFGYRCPERAHKPAQWPFSSRISVFQVKVAHGGVWRSALLCGRHPFGTFWDSSRTGGVFFGSGSQNWSRACGCAQQGGVEAGPPTGPPPAHVTCMRFKGACTEAGGCACILWNVPDSAVGARCVRQGGRLPVGGVLHTDAGYCTGHPPRYMWQALGPGAARVQAGGLCVHAAECPCRMGSGPGVCDGGWEGGGRVVLPASVWGHGLHQGGPPQAPVASLDQAQVRACMLSNAMPWVSGPGVHMCPRGGGGEGGGHAPNEWC